ncbi:MAG: AEC family transporter [Clostridia bacterium]
MILDVFILTVEQFAALLIFFGMGLLLGRCKILPENTGTSLAQLLLYIFMPAMSFLGFAQQFTLTKLSSYLLILTGSMVLMLISLVIGALTLRYFPGNETEKLTASYSMIFSNFGYLGYPLVLASYGQEMLSKFMMFGLPFTILAYVYILPQWMPRGNKQGIRELLKRVFNPMMIAILLGLIWGALGIPMPSLLKNVCQMASNCVSPCAMIITGLAISRVSLKQAFYEKHVLAISTTRLLLLPALFTLATFWISRLTGLNSTLLLIVGAFTAMPLGMNPVIFSETYGRDGTLGAECTCVSLLVGLLTLPLMFELQNWLATLLG